MPIYTREYKSYKYAQNKMHAWKRPEKILGFYLWLITSLNCKQDKKAKLLRLKWKETRQFVKTVQKNKDLQ